MISSFAGTGSTAEIILVSSEILTENKKSKDTYIRNITHHYC
jgi:hypothetical protein